MIVKEFDAITVYIMEKEIVLRLTNSEISAIAPKRSKGVAFEVVKGVMARLSLFGEVDTTLYCGTKCLGVAQDSELSLSVPLPSFSDITNNRADRCQV